MPIYEYRCPNGDTFEVFQKMDEPPPDACPVCGAGPLEKLLFPVAVHFKGSGFYSTDYGRKGSRAGREDGSGPSEKTADKPAEKKTAGGETKSSGASD